MGEFFAADDFRVNQAVHDRIIGRGNRRPVAEEEIISVHMFERKRIPKDPEFFCNCAGALFLGGGAPLLPNQPRF